jgi:hypothetical protein
MENLVREQGAEGEALHQLQRCGGQESPLKANQTDISLGSGPIQTQATSSGVATGEGQCENLPLLATNIAHVNKDEI